MTSHDTTETSMRALNAPRRNQYFYGKRMDVQHFQMEQDYGRTKQALVNRLTLGMGVVCGLKVAIEGERLAVDPGVAIDGLGREIVVPMRWAIDPAQDTAACGGVTIAPNSDGIGLYTLWLCYRQCSADYQPVLATDCSTREQCAPGTTVESFCFKLTRGLAPLQTDPQWCLQANASDAPQDGNVPVPAGNPTAGADGEAGADRLAALLAASQAQRVPGADDIRTALASLRHRLCAGTSSGLGAVPEDPCVPLAAVVFNGARPAQVENCLVRPRIYSNAVLLDLILCLAQRIDACCGEQPKPSLLRVAAIEFLRHEAAGDKSVASVSDPRESTAVPIDGNTNAVRIRFTAAFAQNARTPTTAGANDNDFTRHNVLITPERPLQRVPYVPGSLVIEAADTIRFDLSPESPYSRGTSGWQKGAYRVRLCGVDDAAAKRLAIVDASGRALDGDPAAASNGAISGDGIAGGNFEAAFVIG